MERLLGHLAGLIEQHCGSQTEIESLASELTKALEDIYVYSTVAGQIKSLKFPGHKQTDLAEDIMEAMRMDLVFIVMPQREENNCHRQPQRFWFGPARSEIICQKSERRHLTRSRPRDRKLFYGQ